MACPNVEEVKGSRTGNRTRSMRKYIVYNAEDESAAIAAFEAYIPATIDSLPLLDFRYQESEDIDDQYEFSAEWGYEDSKGGNDLPSSEYRFNFQATGGKFVQSLSTISYHTNVGSDTDPEAVAAPFFGGAINVTKDKEGNRKVEGQDVSPPSEVFSLVYRDDEAVIDNTYQLLVESLVGKVNSSTFRGRAAGTTMLVRAQGSRSGGVWTIEFGFAYIANAVNIPIGSGVGLHYQVDAKDGMDLLWTYYSLVKYDGNADVVPYPTASYVERVWERADLNSLALPA